MRLATLPRPHTASAYKDWLAGRPCLCCGVRPVVLHHLQVWGLPRKRSNPLRDYVVVPLCDHHHRDTGDRHAAHRMKQSAWIAHWFPGGSEDDLLLRQYQGYAEHIGLPLPADIGARQAAEFLLSLER